MTPALEFVELAPVMAVVLHKSHTASDVSKNGTYSTWPS